MTTTEERVSRLEGSYEHVATKADIAQLEVKLAQLEIKLAQMQIEFAQLETRLTRWIIGTGIALGGMILTAVIYLS